jgi:glycosyltransferase involved in cell wall biosynthesis
MRIGVYFSPWGRALSPTGVGRHAIEMTAALAAHPEVEACRFTTRGELERDKDRLPAAIARMPVRLLRGGERLSRWMLMGLPFWTIDDGESDLDWIYCTKEQPVSTRKCRLAVNVHDALPFEGDVPGMPRQKSLRKRLKWGRILAKTRQSDLITTVSEFTKRRLVELLGIDERQIAVIGNGVTDEYFRSSEAGDQELLQRFGIEKQRYFLAVGSLTWRKGGDLLLEAAKLLRQRGMETPILVTGRRHDADLLARYESERQRESSLPLRLLGYVPDEEQRILLSNALAFVFPTRYEGFGIPALEAMAAQTLVICSGTSAMPEVVGEAGMTIDPLTADSLLQCMLAAERDPQNRELLIARGRERVQDFRWSRCAERLVAALKLRS